MNFINLGINPKTTSKLKTIFNISEPTTVQEKAIPLILKDKNIMVQAKTGSGKTLAFLLPILEKLNSVHNECLILVPTRELAKQIHDVFEKIRPDHTRSVVIYGGVSINKQIEKLHRGVQVIVGTPGRIIDLYKRGHLKFNNMKFMVLDEGDRLWDMGFAPDIKYILKAIQTVSKSNQIMLFSATLDQDMRNLVKNFTKNSFMFINLSRDELTVRNTKQSYYMIERFEQKFHTFLKILKKEKPRHALVFVNTKKTASWLSRKLTSLKYFNYRVGLISGALSQYQREQILKAFRMKKINLLIATDVAARGLDIKNVSHVINYDVPKYSENYVHRIGRTSRMNKKGTAITLCLEKEYRFLCNIEGFIDKELELRSLERTQEQDFEHHFPFY
ncbi:MAG: DEAD/DEAH box helicase [Promethearchaeota archaeon]